MPKSKESSGCVAVSDEVYASLTRQLRAGKRANVLDKYGDSEDVMFNANGEIIEKRTKKLVLSQSQLEGRPLTEWGRLIFGGYTTVKTAGSLTILKKGTELVAYHASVDTTIPVELALMIFKLVPKDTPYQVLPCKEGKWICVFDVNGETAVLAEREMLERSPRE